MRKKLVGLTLATAIAMGGAGESSVPYEELKPRETPIEAATAAFGKAQAYWAPKIGNTATRLLIVKENEDMLCDYGYKVYARGEDETAFYCPNPDAIMITEKFLNAGEEAFPGQGDDSARFTVLHEFGHAVANHQREIPFSEYNLDYMEDPVSKELEATLYAGQAAQHILPTFEVAGIQQFIGINPDQEDWAHGPRSAHYDAFTHGLTNN